MVGMHELIAFPGFARLDRNDIRITPDQKEGDGNKEGFSAERQDHLHGLLQGMDGCRSDFSLPFIDMRVRMQTESKDQDEFFEPPASQQPRYEGWDEFVDPETEAHEDEFEFLHL